MSETLNQLWQLHPALVAPEKMWSRAEILTLPSPVPKQPGVYAWYFKQIPPGVPTTDCLKVNGLTLLYVGLSPKAPPKNGRRPSKQTLHSRLRYHMQGNAEGSTLRLTLGCLLSAELDLQLRRVGSGNRLTFCDGEKRLSGWLAENAFVTWELCSEPWLLEEELIRTLDLPLNLHQNASHPFCSKLAEIRKLGRDNAREATVWLP